MFHLIKSYYEQREFWEKANSSRNLQLDDLQAVESENSQQPVALQHPVEESIQQKLQQIQQQIKKEIRHQIAHELQNQTVPRRDEDISQPLEELKDQHTESSIEPQLDYQIDQQTIIDIHQQKDTYIKQQTDQQSEYQIDEQADQRIEQQTDQQKEQKLAYLPLLIDEKYSRESEKQEQQIGDLYAELHNIIHKNYETKKEELTGKSPNYRAAVLYTVLYIFPLFLITFGTVNLKSCPAESRIAVGIISLGCLTLVTRILNCPYDFRAICKQEENDSTRSPCLICVNLIFQIAIMCGFFTISYWILSIHPTTKPEDRHLPNFCDHFIYHHVFWGCVLGLMLFGLGFVGGCIIGFMATFRKAFEDFDSKSDK